MENNSGSAVTISTGIPSVVVGVLIALKHIGMTKMTYGSIIWFGIEVWLVCAAIALVIWFIIAAIATFAK